MTNLLQCKFSTGWHKSMNRCAICDALQTNQLIAQVLVGGDGRIDVCGISWDEYWTSVRQELMPVHIRQLESLNALRDAYIGTGYDLGAASAYCQAFFQLLRDLLARNSPPTAVRALLGLECFEIKWWREGLPLVAGAVTIRHPVYLLAKLREPKAYEDAKFLPVVAPLSYGEGDSHRP